MYIAHSGSSIYNDNINIQTKNMWIAQYTITISSACSYHQTIKYQTCVLTERAFTWILAVLSRLKSLISCDVGMHLPFFRGTTIQVRYKLCWVTYRHHISSVNCPTRFMNVGWDAVGCQYSVQIYTQRLDPAEQSKLLLEITVVSFLRRRKIKFF